MTKGAGRISKRVDVTENKANRGLSRLRRSFKEIHTVEVVPSNSTAPTISSPPRRNSQVTGNLGPNRKY